MLCPNCGHWNDEIEKRCAHCGRLFSEKLASSWKRSGLSENEPEPRRIVPTPSIDAPRPEPAWKSEIERKLEAFRERHGPDSDDDPDAVVEPDSEDEAAAVGGEPPIIPYLPPLGKKPPLRENNPPPFDLTPPSAGPLPPLKRDARPAPQPSRELPPPRRETKGASPHPAASRNGGSQSARPLLVTQDTTPRELLRRAASLPRADAPDALQYEPQAARRSGEINCPDEVAPLSVRAVALALDLGMIELAQAIVAGIYVWQTGASVTDAEGIRTMAAVFVTIFSFYFYFFLRFGGATAGMAWTGLRILNFDGRAPDASQLHSRAVGTIVSFAAAFVGFLWAAVDYEGLTWHDRMSKTFLTCD